MDLVNWQFFSCLSNSPEAQKQPFGANLMKNSGSSYNFRVVIVFNMKAMGGLSKSAALAIVIKVHKRHNKTTIWCQFDENNIILF